MQILLIDPMPKGGLNFPFPVLPLGLSLIAGVAIDHGAQVHAVFGVGYDDDLVQYLKKFKPDIVGMQTFINNFHLCLEIAENIKTKYPDTLIVMGGVEVSNNPDQAFISPFVDCVIVGEGEFIFKKLLENTDDDLSRVPGLIWRDESGNITKNTGGMLIDNLDEIPPIPYPLFYPSNRKIPVGHILTHRGCKFHCSHCPVRFRSGVSIRSHSSAYIMNTIHYLKSTFGISSIEFFDENFTMHRDIVSELCSDIGKLALAWNCTARITQLDMELAEVMANSGCQNIVFGIGSAVSRLQKILGTDEDLDYAARIIRELRKMGVKPIVVFSLGLPTETKEEFTETVNYALRLDAYQIRFEPCAPIPGTRLHDMAKETGRFTIRSWSEYLHPSQIVYIPAGRSLWEFRLRLLIAKVRGKSKNYYMRDIV